MEPDRRILAIPAVADMAKARETAWENPNALPFAQAKNGLPLTAADIDNKNAELFTADWMYDKNDAGSEILYVYNIMFNKKDYKEFENNFAEHASLKKEKV